jgi:hypothetical protein
MLPGTKVKCAYRGEHRGVLLAVDDPRAWYGTLAFGYTRPSRRLVTLHVEHCRSRGLLRETQPVAWPWGVMWDRDLSPAEVK